MTSKDPLDRYYTPQWVVNQAFDIVLPEAGIPCDGRYLDPCCGEGAFGGQAIKRGFDVVTQLDLGRQDCPVDYLEWIDGYFTHHDLGMTNPPFRKAEQFAEKMLCECKSVVLLVRIGFLASKGRAPFWEKHPPSHVFILPQRPKFTGPNVTGKGTDTHDYCFVVWKHGSVWPTQLRWLPLKEESK